MSEYRRRLLRLRRLSADAETALCTLAVLTGVIMLGEIPAALPTPTVPSLPLIVGLVQGAAISGSIPNPDGEYPDASGDFRGQGVANIGSGLFQGMPVGGSVSATALVTSAGARSRTALLVAGSRHGHHVCADLAHSTAVCGARRDRRTA